MAQNLENFHVPQQNRRNKLRFSSNQTPPLQYREDLIHHRDHDHGLSLSLSFPQLNNCKLQRRSSNCEMRNLMLPLGPFTGYASILKKSTFLLPTLQILQDFCGYGVSLEDAHQPVPLMDCFNEFELLSTHHQCNNSKLAMLQDEAYKRYKIYWEQLQSVVSSFEAVPGLRNAAPYLSFGIKLIANHFNRALLKANDTTPSTTFNDDSTNQLTYLQLPIWRSQRGLPDHAVAIFKSWLFQHFLHPYPTDLEKQLLAQQTGLSRTQVSNWFINARVRLWKPMVEEMHMLKSQQEINETAAVTSYPSSSSPNPTDEFAQTHQSSYRHLSSHKQKQRLALALGLSQDNVTESSRPSPVDYDICHFGNERM